MSISYSRHMRCHVCNAEVGEGQRFCHECGQSLAGVTDATQELAAVPTDDDADAPDDDDEASDGAAAAVAAGAGAAAAGAAESGSAETEEVPESEVSGGDGGAPDLADTQEVPESELPGAAAVDDADASDESEPEHDLAPPVAGAAAAGAIGASLFDPDKAPPLAEPDWGAPIPRLSDDSFGAESGDADAASGAVGGLAPPVAAAAAATTAHDPTPPPFDDATALTGQQAVVYDDESDTGPTGPLLEGEIQPFRLKPAFVVAFLGMIAMLMATIADVTDIRTSRVVAGIDNRLSTLDDIGTNLAVAGFVGAALMLVGGLLQCFHIRWGAGMAGGAGLAIMGWAGLTLGLAEVPIDNAERITRDPNTPGPFTLTITRDLGYWLIVAMAGVGLVVFLFSLSSAGTGGRRGLNPWTAALGALASLVAAAGPLITVGGADFGVNFGTDNLPAAFFAGRLVQLGLIAATGVVGFLIVRAYGLGLVLGGISVAFWLWLSSLLELGDRPLGVAAGNLGSSDTTPHAVTSVGIVATLVMLLLSAILAIAARPPRR